MIITLLGKHTNSASVKHVYGTKHIFGTKFLCLEQTGIWFIKGQNKKDFLHWDFILSLVYTGFRFIQGSVQTGFTLPSNPYQLI